MRSATFLGGMQELVFAKQAGARIFVDTQFCWMLPTAGHRYQGSVSRNARFMSFLVVLIVLVTCRVGHDGQDLPGRYAPPGGVGRKEPAGNEAVNRQNQDAILRLMNELGDLADGDLTVTATVSGRHHRRHCDSIN